MWFEAKINYKFNSYAIFISAQADINISRYNSRIKF